MQVRSKAEPGASASLLLSREKFSLLCPGLSGSQILLALHDPETGDLECQPILSPPYRGVRPNLLSPVERQSHPRSPALRLKPQITASIQRGRSIRFLACSI